MREIKIEYMLIRDEIVIEKQILTLEQIEQKDSNEFCYELLEENEKITKRQYAGLKDKNGVEIYEGDIVKIEKCFTNGVDTLSDHIGEIKYLNCRFMAIDEYLNSLCPYEYKNQIEVIGNIYENPDLLNMI